MFKSLLNPTSKPLTRPLFFSFLSVRAGHKHSMYGFRCRPFKEKALYRIKGKEGIGLIDKTKHGVSKQWMKSDRGENGKPGITRDGERVMQIGIWRRALI
ncbi:hypothetical protein JTE90_006824 [Oedothorax gibbosus]|uniref:Uncharacterized protein n=1 Tax=Oedothorax gibbosus TaxID=931172 RepID=A0AAV6U732_9ARAC|nr:hypothetical protein JTE90_006824 [Oedothorax gibbosus]